MEDTSYEYSNNKAIAKAIAEGIGEAIPKESRSETPPERRLIYLPRLKYAEQWIPTAFVGDGSSFLPKECRGEAPPKRRAENVEISGGMHSSFDAIALPFRRR
jgi:hypothetical protein